jgi:hypothetical protein
MKGWVEARQDSHYPMMLYPNPTLYTTTAHAPGLYAASSKEGFIFTKGILLSFKLVWLT